MPTWSQLQEYARGNYALTEDDADGFAIEVALPGGRSQLVGVHRVVAQELEREREWVVFKSFVCKRAALDPEVALRKNAGLLVGALALDKDDDYFIIHAALIETMDADEFEVPLAQIAKIADSLEAELTGADRH